jgi:hypothetical protein
MNVKDSLSSSISSELLEEFEYRWRVRCTTIRMQVITQWQEDHNSSIKVKVPLGPLICFAEGAKPSTAESTEINRVVQLSIGDGVFALVSFKASPTGGVVKLTLRPNIRPAAAAHAAMTDRA